MYTETMIVLDKMDGCELITVSNTGCTLEAKELPQKYHGKRRKRLGEKYSAIGYTGIQ